MTDPRAMLFLLFVMIAALLMTSPFGLAVGATFLAAVAGERRTLRPLLRKLRIVLPMVVMIALLVLLRAPAGERLCTVFGMDITRGALETAFLVGLRLLLVAAASMLFTLLVSIGDAVTALQRLRVPATLVAVAWLTERFLALLTADARRMMEAVHARSAALSFPRRVTVTTRVAGTFLLRAVGRSERLADAMTARGFDGRVPSLRQLRWTVRDTIITATGTAMGILLYCL
ncbi:MAG: energy-coupling factor transporter transmembrane protein EcfT [Bacteroidetes bacterium]|nr:energy-coupling factor transporter transmembrane protein EcfT [Bacteroidota bacterium]